MHSARGVAREKASGTQSGALSPARRWRCSKRFCRVSTGPRAGSVSTSEAAYCARATVYDAIRALDDAGILTWVSRIKQVKERCVDLLGDQGWRWRVLTTSNAYTFRDLLAGGSESRPATQC
jgi:hypothetical protein